MRPTGGTGSRRDMAVVVATLRRAWTWPRPDGSPEYQYAGREWFDARRRVYDAALWVIRTARNRRRARMLARRRGDWETARRLR